MELKEVTASNVSPYRCYVRGKIIQTEGDNVHTLGFKDGIAVVQVINPDTQKSADNMPDNRAIDLTKLRKIIVKVDPNTGKKYIDKDGKRIEILPQLNSLISLKPAEASVIKFTKPDTSQTGPPDEKKSVIFTRPLTIFSGAQFPKLVPTNSNMKVPDNVKYHVLSMNVKKTGKMTACDDKSLQTDSLDRREVWTQTEPLFSDEMFWNFILDSEGENAGAREQIDPNRLKTKEEIDKFSFFNDMRNALNFNQSGNLPIHDSVIQNNLKAVRKNCVVLRAIQENVNILNQHCYAPIHLAVVNDVHIEILKVLLLHGADISVTDPEGNTAIHLAIEHRRFAMLKILINGAAEAKILDVFNYEGFTPLILACLNRSYLDAKLLLQRGADPNIKDMKSGRTALFHAAEAHDVNLVELLMQYRADTKIRNFFGTSPHDVMFELEEIPIKIKFCILGRDHQRFQNKKKDVIVAGPHMKKAKLETTPVLKKVSTSDLMSKSRKK